jgi:hypothetical protein
VIGLKNAEAVTCDYFSADIVNFSQAPTELESYRSGASSQRGKFIVDLKNPHFLPN